MRIVLGSDPREGTAYTVAERSLRRHASSPVWVHRLSLADLVRTGEYRRQTVRQDGRLWDVISEAPMSTEHAIARFLTPKIAGWTGWALSTDCDVLCRGDLAELFTLADPDFAVMVVRHVYETVEGVKMDGQLQTVYARKNWSSVILWNCAHPAHHVLPDLVNTVPGRDLHRFCWLTDDQIGGLPREWNHLVGVYEANPLVRLAHFTLGTPDMPGHESSDFADEWLAVRDAPEEAVA